MKFMLCIALMCFHVIVLSNASASPSKYEMSVAYKVTETYTLDRLTIYNPEAGQTDDTPMIAGPNFQIDADKLASGKLRWMGLSQDMLAITGRGTIEYGQLVHIDAGDSTIDGYWHVYDAMNKRYKKSGDLLFDKSIRSRGKWKNVKLSIVHEIKY